MIVVADTTPLNYLVLINAIDVLHTLFAEVHAPPAVIQELTHSRAPDAGEAEAISLAKELGIRDILIDERRGRNIATRLTTFRVPQEKIDAMLRRDQQRKQSAADGPPSQPNS